MTTFARHPLAAAVVATLSLTAIPVLHATQLIVTNGSTQVASGTYDTTGMTGLSNPFALAAANSGSRINGSNVTAITASSGAHAVFADLAGRIDLTDASIRTTGANSYGVLADQLGTVNLTRATIDVSGPRPGPGPADSSGAVVAIAGGTVKIDDSSLRVTNGAGLVASGVGSRIEASKTGIQIVSGTTDAHGVSAQGNALITLDRGSSVDVRNGGVGLRASGLASEVRANDTTITTRGGSGVVAVDGGRVTLDGTSVDVSEGRSGFTQTALLATGSGSRVSVVNSTLRSRGAAQALRDQAVTVERGAQVDLGEGTHVYADGVGASATWQGSKLHADGATIESGDLGLYVDNGAEVTLSNGASITGSRGAEVFGTSGARLVGNKATIQATGTANGVGIVLGNSAVLDLSDSIVSAQGHALEFRSSQGARPNSATVSGGRLSSATNAAIFAGGNPGDNRSELHLRNGVQVTGANNQLVRVAAGNQPVRLSIFGDAVALNGDMVAEPGAYLNLALSNGSSLRGAIANGYDVGLDKTSRWDITRDSDITSLRSAGTISFAVPATGDFKTLTVHGNYIGEGGTLAISTALAGNDSKSDRVVVHGSTSGNTTLAVTNAGGAGANTTGDGIQVVQVDGASAGEFALSGRVVAGANEYLLVQGGKSNPADGDWYLRSEAPSSGVSPTIPAPPRPTSPTPVYRPEIGAYLGNQHAAVTMFNQTMHDRVGQPTFSEDSRSGDRGGAAWVRVGRDQFDATTGARQVETATDTELLQVGGELASWTTGDSRFHIGGMGGWGRANTHVGSEVTRYGAKGRVTGYNLGVYGTWFADAKSFAGLYVDGSLQGGRFSNRVEGDYLPRESYDSQSLSASIEAGYAIALLSNDKSALYLQPQAQVIYTGYEADQHVESNGSLFTSEDAGGLTTRVGARLLGNAVAAINRVQPFLEVNWWHAGEGDSITLGGQRVDWDLPQDVYEAKLGAQIELGGQWSGWGHVASQSGAGEFRSVDGQVGLMRRW